MDEVTPGARSTVRTVSDAETCRVRDQPKERRAVLAGPRSQVVAGKAT
jgi:hypothetical protein